MRFQFKPSFERSLKALGFGEQEHVQVTANKVAAFYESGVKTEGLGIKRMRGNYWEARAGIRNRLLYRFEGDLVEFVLAGDHEDIRRFLKHH